MYICAANAYGHLTSPHFGQERIAKGEREIVAGAN